jgi:hypothetical protein
MTSLPARPFELSNFHKSSPWDIIKHHWTPMNMSLSHAMACLFLCPFALFYHAPDFNIPGWFQGPDGYLLQPTPIGISLVFLMSCTYYIWDTFCIFEICKRVRGGPLRFDDYGYLFHHLSCGLGMFFPAVLVVDGPLVLFAFILGEVSNPPRGIAEAYEFEMDAMRIAYKNFKNDDYNKANIKKKQLQDRFSKIWSFYLGLLDFHFYSFVVLRIVLTWYTFYVVLPYAQLSLTFIAALLMTLFSFASVIILVMQRNDRSKIMDKLGRVDYDPSAAVEQKKD